MTRALLVLWATCAVAHAAPSHQRLETAGGPVHVWTPDGYDRATAGIVVYVHGYFTGVDEAWREHRLARQFAASHLNALFVACEAPRGPDDGVRWPMLGTLLDAVASATPLPEGRLAVVGHSGAHRTLAAWLDTGAIDTLVLVDALYDDPAPFLAWLVAEDHRRLLHAARLTRRWSDELRAQLPETLVIPRFPRRGELAGATKARVVYVRSQLDHMQLVTGGRALPMLLRALQISRL